MKVTKKTIFIFADFFSEIGGTENFLFNLLKETVKQNIKIFLFVSEKPKNKIWVKNLPEQITLVTTNLERDFNDSEYSIEFDFIKEIYDSYFSKYSPDKLIFIPNGKLLVAAIKFFIENNEIDVLRKKIISYEYSIPCSANQDWYPKHLKEYINYVDQVLVTCVASKKGLREIYGYKGKALHKPHLLNVRNEFKSIPNATLYRPACIARLSKEKNIDLLIHSVNNLLSRIPQIVLSIYGSGPEKANLEKLIKKLNLEKKVILMGTFDPIVGIEKIISKHDLFLQPSSFESIPTTLLECLYYNRTMFASNVGGIHEILKSDFLFDDLSEKSISEKIISFYSNPKFYFDLTDELSSDIRERYDPEKTTKEYLLSII